MLALQLTRLSERSRQAAVMAERNRVVRDIPDTLAHAFTGVIVQLEAADDAAAHGLEAEAGAHVARAEALARTGLNEARRSVMALRPQALEGSDLATALSTLLTHMTPGTALVGEFVQGLGDSGWLLSLEDGCSESEREDVDRETGNHFLPVPLVNLRHVVG